VIKAEFIIITPVFSVTWPSTNHSNMRIWWSRNIYDYYQCWTQLFTFLSILLILFNKRNQYFYLSFYLLIKFNSPEIAQTNDIYNLYILLIKESWILLFLLIIIMFFFKYNMDNMKKIFFLGWTLVSHSNLNQTSHRRAYPPCCSFF